MHEKIKSQIKDAMRAKDVIRLEVLRGLTSAFTNELFSKKNSTQTLSDEDVVSIIRRAVKQRKDSIEQFEKGGREDLVKKERAELAILETFLPKLMTREEIRVVVEKKISQTEKPDKAKLGQFIGMIMKNLKGKADGADVKAVVEELVK